MCEICGSRYVNALGHEIVFTEPVYPTCTEPGIMRHYECTRCGKSFMDSAGTQEGMMMPALGHQLTPVAKVEPTCTTPGTEAYWQCTRCDKLFSEFKWDNEITAPAAIPARRMPGGDGFFRLTRAGSSILPIKPSMCPPG